jgi:hypothetical protein
MVFTLQQTRKLPEISDHLPLLNSEALPQMHLLSFLNEGNLKSA